MKRTVVLLLALILMLSSCNSGNRGEDVLKESGAPISSEEVNASKTPSATEEVTPEDLKAESFQIAKESYPRVDGNFATLPLSYAVYESLTGATHEEAEANITHCKPENSGPYFRLYTKEVDLIIATEPEQELLNISKEQGVSFTMKPIAYDALVFLANQSNPVHELTHQQIVDIYSGKIINWSEVGGETSEILPFQNENYTGSQYTMGNYVMKDVTMLPAPHYCLGYTESEQKTIATYDNRKNSLGYSSFYYETFMAKQQDQQILKVNGVEPSHQTIKDKTYPYITTYYAIIRSNEPTTSNTYQLYEWLTSKKAQKLIASHGYVPFDSRFDYSSIIPEIYEIDKASLLSNHANNTKKLLALKDNERIMLPLSEKTLLLIDNKVNITNYFNNAYYWLSTDSYAHIIDDQLPLALSVFTDYRTNNEVYEYENPNYGIYNLRSNSWILPFDHIRVGSTKRFLCSEDAIYDYEGNLLFKLKVGKELLYTLVGNVVYVNDISDIDYCDENILIVKQLKSFISDVNNQYRLHDRNDNPMLLSPDGDIVFDVATFQKLNKCKVSDFDYFFQYVNEETHSVIVKNNERYYITDFEGKIIESIPEEFRYVDNDVFFKYTDNGCTIRCFLSGEETEIVLSKGTLRLFSEYGSDSSINYPYSMFSQWNPDAQPATGCLYYYDKLITSCDSFYKFSDNCVVTYLNNSDNTVQTQIYVKDTCVYTSSLNEKIIYADENGMLIHRGNVFILSDYQGNILYKAYENIQD